MQIAGLVNNGHFFLRRRARLLAPISLVPSAKPVLAKLNRWLSTSSLHLALQPPPTSLPIILSSSLPLLKSCSLLARSARARQLQIARASGGLG